MDYDDSTAVPAPVAHAALRPHQPRVPHQPLGAVAHHAAPRAGARLAAVRARPPAGAADARGGALRRPRRARRWRAGRRCKSGLDGSRRHADRARIAIFASVTACQSFLPRAAGGLSPAPPRHPHPARDRLRRRRARACWSEGRVDVAWRRCPTQVPRALVARVLLYTPLVFVAPARSCEVEPALRRPADPVGGAPDRAAGGRRRRARRRSLVPPPPGRRRRSTARCPATRRSCRSSAWAAASASSPAW